MNRVCQVLLRCLCMCQFFALSKSECQNPDEIELEMMLLDLELNSINVNVSSLARKVVRPNKINMDNSECGLLKQSTTAGFTLCPSKHVLTKHDNEYPFIQKNVVCSCANCRGLSKNKYGCRPIIDYVPVLSKKECASNGIFKWEPTYKPVIAACSCFVKF